MTRVLGFAAQLFSRNAGVFIEPDPFSPSRSRRAGRHSPAHPTPTRIWLQSLPSCYRSPARPVGGSSKNRPAEEVGAHLGKSTLTPVLPFLLGLDADNPHKTRGLISWQGVITIRAGKASLTIGGEDGSVIFLQDQSKLYCLPTTSGLRLVFASYCFARQCAPVDYRVIDPATVRVISRQNADNECDARCAEKALGAKLPAALNAL